MGKNMAMLYGDIVYNIIWCSENHPETDTLKNTGGRSIAIGDTYTDGKWYRNSVEILTQLESMTLEIEQLQAENAILINDIATMIDEIYQSDFERIEA